MNGWWSFLGVDEPGSGQKDAPFQRFEAIFFGVIRLSPPFGQESEFFGHESWF